MEITKREVITSIVIVAIMLLLGFVISEKITDYQNDKNAEYQKAIHIDDAEIFQYGMNTNVGNAFVYGVLNAVDTVTFDEIGGEYLYVEKVEERYERHEEWVTEKDSSGEERKEKKVWYEWEYESSESRHVEEIEFCGIRFHYGKINLPAENFIQTIKGEKTWSWKSGERVKVRFKYYGVSTRHIGTIYTKLSDGTISNDSRFFENMTPEEALKDCAFGIGNIIFWIFWICLIGAAVYGFCYLENEWLED